MTVSKLAKQTHSQGDLTFKAPHHPALLTLSGSGVEIQGEVKIRSSQPGFPTSLGFCTVRPPSFKLLFI